MWEWCNGSIPALNWLFPNSQGHLAGTGSIPVSHIYLLTVRFRDGSCSEKITTALVTALQRQ